MNLKQYIGHDSFRVVISDRWPPKNGEGFGRWLQHLDGTLLFYVRGVAAGGDKRRAAAGVERGHVGTREGSGESSRWCGTN